jgi:hypothetical protein
MNSVEDKYLEKILNINNLLISSSRCQTTTKFVLSIMDPESLRLDSQERMPPELSSPQS